MEFNFKKIVVDSNTFNEVLDKVYQAYDEGDEATYKLDMAEALKKYLFDVEEEFDADGWNSCTVLPPREYDSYDVIIRTKNLYKHPGGYTDQITQYKLAFIDHDFDGVFRNMEHEPVINPEEFRGYEYKLIK